MECIYCGGTFYFNHEREHPEACCDCYEIYELKLGLSPFEYDKERNPDEYKKILDKVESARKRGHKLPC